MDAVGAFEDRLFSARRLCICALILIGVTILHVAWEFESGTWIFDRQGHLRLLDFVWLWTAGGLAIRGAAVQAYDYAAFAAAQQALVGPLDGSTHYSHWVYPPTMFFWVAPFALLPYLSAFLAWCVATCAVYLSAIWTILRRPATLLLALAPAVVGKNFLLGQNGLLTAGIIGLALTLVQRAPFLAGVTLGLLAYKPQIGLLFPIVLIAAGRWRMIGGAALCVLIQLGISTLLFGPAAWTGFLQALSTQQPQTLVQDPEMVATLQTVFGIMTAAGSSLGAAWTAQIGVALLAAVFACLVWRRPLPFELKAAALSAAALLSTPYLLAYDLAAAIVPAAFLIRLGLRGGFLPGERSLLVLCFLLLLDIAAPVGPPVLMLLLASVLRRLLDPPPLPSRSP
jgi:arabinofuranan 3-O-arabinosyltransferase